MIKDQAELEQKYPDRFGDGTDWIALAGSFASLPQNPRPEEIKALADEHETTRMRAQFLSLAGIDAVQSRWNEYARAIRTTRDPWTIQTLSMAVGILTEAQKAPDRRLNWSQWAKGHNLPPRSVEIKPEYFARLAAQRAQAAARRRNY